MRNIGKGIPVVDILMLLYHIYDNIIYITKRNASGESKLAPRCVKIGTGVSKLVKKRLKHNVR